MIKLKTKDLDSLNLVPTNDYVFKGIFGRKGSESTTESLIRDFIGLTDVEVEEVYESKVLEKDIIGDKLGILDVLAKTKNNEYINIEMQCGNYGFIKDRLTFYLCKTFGMEALRAGENYKDTRRTVAVLICKDKLDVLKTIPKWRTSWHIREDEYKTEVLTNKLEVVIIELEKITEKIYKNEISKASKEYIWYKFFLNPNELGEKELKENEGVRKAKEKYDEMVGDLAEARLALSRQMAIMDKNSIRQEGIDEGIEKGKAEGDKERQIKIAKEMLKAKESIEKIIQYTELTEKEIKNIQEELE